VAHFKLYFRTSGHLCRQRMTLSIWLLLAVAAGHPLEAGQVATGLPQGLL